MQHSSSEGLPSLSSTHPINGEGQATKAHDQATGAADSTTRQIRQATGLAKRSAHQRAVQSAKQEIRSRLREDWHWPSLGSQEEQPGGHTELNLPESENAWHQRESDSSTSSISDLYRFESPDAKVQPVRVKRRRRHQMESEETAWNQGLRHFIERRNAWTGSQVRRQPTQQSRPSQQPSSTSPYPLQDEGGVYTEQQSLQAPNDTPQPLSTSPSTSMLTPIAPPILPPDHEVRVAITPAAYPSIYNKIIVQGLTPTIPINLHDLVGAVVEGWRTDGEWPPKSEIDQHAGVVEKGDASVNGVKDGSKKLARKGMGKFKKALGIGQEDCEANEDMEHHQQMQA